MGEKSRRFRRGYLWLDAKHVKVRSGVRSKALVMAYAVYESGRRAVIGLAPGEVESGGFGVEFMRSLGSRVLAGVRLAISDHHEGLKATIAPLPARARLGGARGGLPGRAARRRASACPR